MPKKYYEISESAEELLNMIKKEKNGRFRDRLRLLWLLKTGEAESVTRAAELCGVSRLTAAERFRRYVTGGTAEVRDNKVLVLADSIELKEEIDVERAKQSYLRAKERLTAKSKGDIDVARAEASLQRAINRMKMAGKNI